MYSGCGLHSAAVNLKLEPVCNKSYQFGADITFDNVCNINVCDVKYEGDCISRLAFMRGTLFDPTFGGLSRCYPTGQGIIPFEVRWSPQEWTCVLEPV
jgi:hypothetical protein